MAYRHIWNGLLVVLGIGLCGPLFPQIIGQLEATVRHEWDPLFSTWLAEMTGLLFATILALASLGSWTWKANGPKTWWLFTIASTLLLVGNVAVAVTVYRNVNHLLVDYVAFPLFVVGVSLPIIFFHTGYVGLAIHAWRRRDRSSKVAS